jgi:hypothetical protein
MSIYERITKNYLKYFDKYRTKKNQLLSAILYGINILSKDELTYVIDQLRDYNELIFTKDVAFEILNSLILNYIALNMIYSLPHLLNKPNYNSCCSIHIIFGESISQLAAFCLITESSNILNQILKNNRQMLTEISNIDIGDDELILNLTEIEINKEIIKNDYNNKIKKMIEKYKEYYKCLFKI